ncbi:MAG TPA: serine/threonine-protein kinase [Terracidiphilus sp.]
MPQDAAQWDTIQTLFHLMEETPDSERTQVLSERCHDPELRRRVMSMVRGAHFGEDSAVAASAAHSHKKIGPYSLIQLLGAGGIGSVFLAERIRGGSPQRVALKVLAPHAAGPSFVERFHREQHILGSLDHQNITRLLDAGISEDGQPYLAMEYVNGVHLDTFCDSRQLGIRERIELFLRICDAVAYAHRNLVVHLDLKPSNVLVSQEGVVKLLDFGTSKLIQPDSLLTTTVLATPAYASPEQLRNQPVTTACDVYSLGAVLFDLLAGPRPASMMAAAAIYERAMTEAEPNLLSHSVSAESASKRGVSESRLRQILAGELETIAAKCLRPRPSERYASVDALADDLRRYLDGRAVLARPQTALYRLGKFVRRNRKAALAASMAALALAGSLGYAGWRQQQALEEGRRALRMQTFLYRLFKLANSNYTGKPAATVPEFLSLGVKMLPQYIKDPADLRQAQLSLAESIYENGDQDSALKVFLEIAASAKSAGDVPAEAEAETFAGNIDYLQGQMDPGKDLTAHALELSRRPGVPATVRVWAETFYAWDRENNGFRDDSNVAMLRRAVKDSQDNNLPMHETADALYNLGSDLELRGDLSEAKQAFEKALQVYDQDPAPLCDQSGIYGELAYVEQMSGDLKASLPLYQKAYDGYKVCSGPESRGALLQEEYLAGSLIKLGRAQEALPMMQSAMPVLRKLLGTSPDLAEPLNFLALAEVETGHYADAEQHAREMVEVQTGKVEAGDRRFGASHLLWARALVGQGRYRDALPHAEIADQLLARNAVSVGAKQAAAQAHQVLSDIRARLGQQ